jgi:LmbE family N-acetylglucosaminyl deacetylase
MTQHPRARRRRFLPLAQHAVLALAIAQGSLPDAAAAQGTTTGATAADVALQMRQLDGVKRVLMIAAHPDDEDSSLLAALSRRWGAETAYLSLTRGDGGQNLIGPELGEGLGVVRTGELIAARELDGGSQFFTRAYDFGYTKSAEETLRFWEQDQVLADAVWIVRRFRPHVIVSQWSGTPSDGHGQHQAAGIVAHEVLRAAADPERFPEQLTDGVEPWRATKLYRGAWRTRGDAVLEVHTGTFDPLLGRSHFQLGMASRSMHRSQDMGVRQFPGPRVSRIELVTGPEGLREDDSPFAGVDTAFVSILAGVAGNEREALRRELGGYRDAIVEARSSLDVAEPWRSAPILAEALRHLRVAAEQVAALPEAPLELITVLERRQTLVERTMLAAAGITLELRVDDDLLVPGEEVTVHAELWNGGGLSVTGATPRVFLPRGWTARWAEPDEIELGRSGFFGGPSGSQNEGPADVGPGELARWSYRLSIPPDAEVSRLYYLAEERDRAMYHWPDDRALWGLPRNPPLLVGTIRARVSHSPTMTPIDVAPIAVARYLGVDKATGEYRKPPLVVPAVSVAVTPPGMVWPVEVAGSRQVTVVVSSEAVSGSEGMVALELPDGWTAEPPSLPFTLEAPGASRSFTFSVSPAGPVATGEHVFKAVAETADGRRYQEGVALVDYPHIERVALFTRAEARVSAFSARVTPDLRVAYIMGSGDVGPAALRQLGVTVDELGPDAVRAGQFDDHDVVVLGVRAYETRADLAAANDQLLDFVRRGGTVVVQYNQREFTQGGYGPFRIQISRDRVSEENAPVTVLEPGAPVLSGPNRITNEDFDGWVQERGLYFPDEWDARYRPLLSMADTGEEAKTGPLLVAPVGEGVYVYTSLSFFRQFPAGVPGAYRLFANLVSLKASAWNDYLSAESAQP